jgi:hypothetical protein
MEHKTGNVSGRIEKLSLRLWNMSNAKRNVTELMSNNWILMRKQNLLLLRRRAGTIMKKPTNPKHMKYQ